MNEPPYVCSKCKRRFESTNNLFSFWPPQNNEDLWVYFRRQTNHVNSASTIPPYLDRNMENGADICVVCIEEMELEALRGYPLEDLPLYVNVKWLTEEGRALYKERLSGTIPSK